MSTKPSSITNSLDSILIHLGDLGKYQIYVFSLICVSVVMHSMVHVAYVFTAMNLNYRCKISQCDHPDRPEYIQPWINNAIPLTDSHLEKCSMYATLDNDADLNNCSSAGFNKDLIESCESFVYDGREETILQEYGLQCNNNLWKLTMVGTVNNIGQFFGLIISGIISDKYGRKCLLVWGMILCAVCGCIKAFMPTYEWFLVFEFLDAAFGSGSYICGFVLGAELVGPSKRVLTGTLISSCYAVGEVLLALIAWLLKSWKYIILTSYMPIFLLISYLWLIPESVRWNMSKGRIEDAKKTLRRVAEVNGKNISEKELEVLDAEVLNQTESSTSLRKSGNLLLEAIQSGTLMVRLVACCVCWITCTFLFYGLTLNSVSLVAGNNYLDFILTALVEIPAYFACNFVVNTYGRKKTLCYSYLLTGAACLAFVFIPPTSRWGSLSVYLIGKFGATASFTILYIITSEMFPTNLRHSFMGTCSTFGRCGSMISPQTPLLAQFWEPFPLVSFAGMSILAGLLTLIFPETLNKKLPDTVYEAEMVGKPYALDHLEIPVKQPNSLERF